MAEVKLPQIPYSLQSRKHLLSGPLLKNMPAPALLMQSIAILETWHSKL
jgi:hypothetical protein